MYLFIYLFVDCYHCRGCGPGMSNKIVNTYYGNNER